MWQRQSSQSLDPDPGAAFWGAGLVAPSSRNHTLFPVGTGLERRTRSHEEAPQMLIYTGSPECRKPQGKSSTQQDSDASVQE